MILTGFGLGLTISPTNTDALSRVSAAERAQGSGLMQTIRQLGGTVGVAVVSAVVLGIESAGTQSPSDQRVAVVIAVASASRPSPSPSRPWSAGDSSPTSASPPPGTRFTPSPG